MIWFRYRKSGGYVFAMSGDAASAASWPDDVVFGVLTDPPTLDGVNLGVPKKWDGTDVRDATQTEIDGFPAQRDADELLIDRDQAAKSYTDDPVLRKALVALVKVLVDEINTLRALHSLPDRTLAQAKTAIQNAITNGDVD